MKTTDTISLSLINTQECLSIVASKVVHKVCIECFCAVFVLLDDHVRLLLINSPWEIAFVDDLSGSF